MPQFIPPATALLQKYWRWGMIICWCLSVPESPDGDGKKGGKEQKSPPKFRVKVQANLSFLKPLFSHV